MSVATGTRARAHSSSVNAEHWRNTMFRYSDSLQGVFAKRRACYSTHAAWRGAPYDNDGCSPEFPLHPNHDAHIPRRRIPSRLQATATNPDDVTHHQIWLDKLVCDGRHCLFPARALGSTKVCRRLLHPNSSIPCGVSSVIMQYHWSPEGRRQPGCLPRASHRGLWDKSIGYTLKLPN